MEIFLTQEIDNEKGYVDQVVSEIKAVPKDEMLNMLITCVGGDIFQGDRINRALLEHDGHTKATVIGLAASMGGVLLSAFDEVEIDSDAEIMLHKAHIPGIEYDELTDEQRQGIDRFNRRAHARLESMGVDDILLDEIFLSKEIKDVWLTAKEAESLGLGKVVKIERRNSKPFAIAAKLDIQKIKNDKVKMGLFNKNKKVTRVATLKDGRQVVFTSEKETIEVGSIVNLVGSNELLTGKLRFQNNLIAEIDEENKVSAMEEEEVSNEVSDDEKAQMMESIKELQEAVSKILEAMNAGGEEEEVAAAKAKVDKEYKDKMKEMEETKDTLSALLKNTLEVAKNIKGDFKPMKVEDKHESIMDNLAHLSTNEKRAIQLRAVLNDKNIK
jgi:ATP-dependent protease ClpP protease subunit